MKNRTLSTRVNAIRPRLFALASLGHLTADKMEIKDSPKLPSATSFIRERYTKLCS
jgi:hypothetical protein